MQFNDLTFEKAEEGKKRKRLPVYGERDLYAKPPFAYQITKDESVNLVDDLRKTGNAALFSDSLESNDVCHAQGLKHRAARKFTMRN